MSTTDIPLDKAILLSVLLEALSYGFSLLMFGGTIWTLLSQWSTHPVNRKMLTVACLLLLFSTTHFVIDIVRVMQGLIFFRDTYPGGSIGYFSDISQWTFVSKNYVFAVQTLLGDGVVLYRCYAVWQSKLVMILPALLWCATGITGIACPYTASQVTQNEVFVGSLSRWITSFWVLAFATNVLTTLLLVCRIWHVDRKATRLSASRKQSQLRPILQILVDAGIIYSLTLFVAMICFASRTNGHYVILDPVTPIISITFYMVIIRVGLGNRANQSTDIPLAYTSTDNNLSAERRRRMQVRVTTLTESKIDLPLVSLTSPIGNKDSQSEIRLDNVQEVV
ncbi:hypothetical protein HD554DRAFT_2030893 [Boletus coccyginus]|nr:hypothetical protein HD554DRAFT_2030893 [Boletus coccyginus]